MRKTVCGACALAIVAILSVGAAPEAEKVDLVKLPDPQTEGGMPLMQALKARHTTRSFAAKPLPQEVLSNLLWAAFGVNRPESGKRTAPSAVNWQEIDVYAATADGLFLYEARTHSLKKVLSEDIREMTGTQRFVQTAPVDLIYVADYSRMRRASPQDKDFYSAVDTGLIVQNVYLFAASEKLATVVVGLVKRDELARRMNLTADQRVILTQPVGYPAE